MKTYKVTINPKCFSYIITSPSEERAQEVALKYYEKEIMLGEVSYIDVEEVEE